MPTKIYEYDSLFFPHPDNKQWCEKSNECGEPCICQTGKLVCSVDDTIRGEKLIKIMGVKDTDHIVGFFRQPKDQKWPYDFVMYSDNVRLLAFEHFERDGAPQSAIKNESACT